MIITTVPETKPGYHIEVYARAAQGAHGAAVPQSGRALLRRMRKPAAARQQMPTTISGSPNITYAQAGLSPAPQMLSTMLHPYQAKPTPSARSQQAATTLQSVKPSTMTGRGASRIREAVDAYA
jgi:hypothetical protein